MDFSELINTFEISDFENFDYSMIENTESISNWFSNLNCFSSNKIKDINSQLKKFKLFIPIIKFISNKRLFCEWTEEVSKYYSSLGNYKSDEIDKSTIDVIKILIMSLPSDTNLKEHIINFLYKIINGINIDSKIDESLTLSEIDFEKLINDDKLKNNERIILLFILLKSAIYTTEKSMQNHLIKTLKNQNNPRRIIILGTTGVGKTTLIKILMQYFEDGYDAQIEDMKIDESKTGTTKLQEYNIKFKFHEQTFIIKMIDSIGLCGAGCNNDDLIDQAVNFCKDKSLDGIFIALNCLDNCRVTKTDEMFLECFIKKFSKNYKDDENLLSYWNKVVIIYTMMNKIIPSTYLGTGNEVIFKDAYSDEDYTNACIDHVRNCRKLLDTRLIDRLETRFDDYPTYSSFKDIFYKLIDKFYKNKFDDKKLDDLFNNKFVKNSVKAGYVRLNNPENDTDYSNCTIMPFPWSGSNFRRLVNNNTDLIDRFEKCRRENFSSFNWLDDFYYQLLRVCNDETTLILEKIRMGNQNSNQNSNQNINGKTKKDSKDDNKDDIRDDFKRRNDSESSKARTNREFNKDAFETTKKANESKNNTYAYLGEYLKTLVKYRTSIGLGIVSVLLLTCTSGIVPVGIGICSGVGSTIYGFKKYNE